MISCMLPAPPPGGGYLVLSKAQFADKALVALIREAYPTTKIVEQRPIPLR